MATIIQPSTVITRVVRLKPTQVKKITVGVPIRRVTASTGTLAGLDDTDTSSLPNGAVLIWNSSSEKFVSKLEIDQDQDINGGSY